jgi:hypothetical protein
MRMLTEIPAQFLDPRTGAPAWGTYRGVFRRVDLGPITRDRFECFATQKRWFYGAITAEPLLLAFAIVDLGYAAHAFACAYEHGRGLLVDRSMMGVPGVCRVAQKGDRRIDARFLHPSGSLRVLARDGDPAIEAAIRLADLEVRAALETRGAPPPITAVAPIPRGHVNVTEKGALLSVRGAALVAGRRVALDGACAGYDFTQGLLARRTRWNWAFLVGCAATGERVALNLVQGFVGEPECVAWIDRELIPLAEGRFEFDRDAPESPWRIRTEDLAVDLRFEPGAVHAEQRDYRLVRSRFVQPLGAFSGTIRAADRVFRIERALGVVEDQDVTW